MHFVCRNELNITDFGDGIFETGKWFVAAEHAATVRVIALHETKEQLSFRQGRVIGRRPVTHEGKTRWVFKVRDDGQRRAWVGNGTGEKGYARG